MLKLIITMIVIIITAAGQAADLHALMTAKPGQFSHYHHQLSSLQHSQAQHQQAAMAAAFGTITSCMQIRVDT